MQGSSALRWSDSRLLKKTTVEHASQFRERVARKLGILTEEGRASLALGESGRVTPAVSIQGSERQVAETRLPWQPDKWV